ncbi:AP2-containing protein [Hordeum vulgare]|nr:AP2-containing protein [Hordeum vulgare]
MPPKKTPESKMVFFGVRAKSSHNFGAESIDDGRRFWLDMYSIVDKGVTAYDVAVWCAGSLRSDLNFPKIETQADMEFVVRESIHVF